MTPKTIILLAVWNLIVCGIYYCDKLAAIKGTQRISEKTLLGIAFLFGGVGAYIGMKVFHHKTRHTKFMILVPLFAIIEVLLIYAQIRTN